MVDGAISAVGFVVRENIPEKRDCMYSTAQLWFWKCMKSDFVNLNLNLKDTTIVLNQRYYRVVFVTIFQQTVPFPRWVYGICREIAKIQT